MLNSLIRLKKLFEIEYLPELLCYGLLEDGYFYEGSTPFDVLNKYYREYKSDKHLVG